MSEERPARLDDTEVESKATPQELIGELRSGRTDAAYELLGRQAPVKAWQEALSVLARAPSSADLELAAHRALRRPPAVVAALLALAEEVGTPQAAFVARAVASLRPEEGLAARADDLRAAILTQHDMEVGLAAEDGLGSLYLILARDLPEEAELVQRLHGDEPSRRLVSRALEQEYQRLLELGRTVRWKSGSYRYFLRHALADIALLAELGGRIGDLSFRLLQQQVETPEENEELISYLPVGTRRRFFGWALQRENANQQPTRTRFVLRVVRQYPDDVDRRAVISALQSKDPDVRIDALVSAVALDPGRSDVDGEIAASIDELDESVARRLLRELFALEPGRLRLDRISASKRHLIVEAGAERPAQVTQQVAALLRELRDVQQVEPLVTLAEEVAAHSAEPDGAFTQIAEVLATRAGADMGWSQAFDHLLAGARLGRAMWSALPDLEGDLQAHVYRRLVMVTEPGRVGPETKQLLERIERVDDALVEAIGAEVLEGALEVDALSATDEAFRARLVERAEEVIVPLEAELARARVLLGQGREQAERDLREGLRPIIERAIERADGNPRLQEDYGRLLPPPIDAEPPITPPAPEVSENTLEELDRVGARTELSGGILHIELTPGDDERSRGQLRYLAVLDQRLSAAGTAPAGTEAVLTAYVEALGRRGDARQLVSDLFERGPLFKLALGLSAGTRSQLVQAAVANGLSITEHWYDDPALGEWLLSLELDGRAARAGQDGKPSTPLAALEHARGLNAEVETARSKTERLLHEAKLAFVGESSRAFEDLELAIDGYIQLWHALSGMGISQVAALGSVVDLEEIDPRRHEIVGDPSSARFVVRAAGIAVDGEVVSKARIEGIGS